MENIQKALSKVSQTKEIIVAEKAIDNIAETFARNFPGSRAVIVVDDFMNELFGKTVSDQLVNNMIGVEDPVLLSSNQLKAKYVNVQYVEDELKKHNAIPIAIGSGVINDLVKLAAHNVGRQYMVVITAASVDGYTAYGSSVTINGSKETFSCPAPLVCLADINIIKTAPLRMTAAGYADVFAKITAGADWLLADSLNEEKIDNDSWGIVQNGLHHALSKAALIKTNDSEALSLLTKRLLLCGLGIQSANSTRPASGAEHHFSHLWDMENHLHDRPKTPHGFQVAIGILAITALYEEFLRTDVNVLDIDEACEVWPSLEEVKAEAEELFLDTGFLHVALDEITAKYIRKEQLRDQLILLKNNWNLIKERVREQIIPYEKVRESFSILEIPFTPEKIGISRDYLKGTYKRSYYIRRKFTILDVAVRSNLLDYWLDKIFQNSQYFN